MSTNPNNFGSFSGNLASAPAVFPNQDGSHTVKMTVMTTNDYLGADGKRGSSALSLDCYVPANKSIKQFASLTKGSPVHGMFTVRTNSYQRSTLKELGEFTGQDGQTYVAARRVTETVYESVNQLDRASLRYDENKAAAEARKARVDLNSAQKNGYSGAPTDQRQFQAPAQQNQPVQHNQVASFGTQPTQRVQQAQQMPQQGQAQGQVAHFGTQPTQQVQQAQPAQQQSMAAFAESAMSNTGGYAFDTNDEPPF